LSTQHYVLDLLQHDPADRHRGGGVAARAASAEPLDVRDRGVGGDAVPRRHRGAPAAEYEVEPDRTSDGANGRRDAPGGCAGAAGPATVGAGAGRAGGGTSDGPPR